MSNPRIGVWFGHRTDAVLLSRPCIGFSNTRQLSWYPWVYHLAYANILQ